MSKTTVIRYKTHPEHAQRNAELIEAVFSALARKRPAGLNYQVLRAEDGLQFTHVVSLQEGQGEHPLTSLPEFKAFTADIRRRCEIPPQSEPSGVLGRYDDPASDLPGGRA